MAAEIHSVLSVVKERAREKLKLITNVDKEIEGLESEFDNIQRELNSMEERQEEESVKRWLEDLKHVSYEADDVLDKWQTEKLRANVDCFSFIQSTVRSCTDGLSNLIQNSFLHQFWVRWNVGHEIEPIKKRIGEVLRDKPEEPKQSSNEEADKGRGSSSSQNKSDSGLFDDKLNSKFFARAEAKDRITKLMETSKKSVISLTGIDGVGKTYLARNLCNDSRMRTHFETIIWVNVPSCSPSTRLELVRSIKMYKSTSADSKPEEINVVKKIKVWSPGSATEETSLPSGDFDELTEENAKKLEEWTEEYVMSGKRVLLVLDDAKDFELESFSPLLNPFTTTAADGSKILVTSDNEEIANLMANKVGTNVHPERLDPLSCPKHSWSLFADKNDARFKDVKDIGEKIIEKCGGFPLAIKFVRRYLGSIGPPDRGAWEEVLRSNIWKLEGQKAVYPALTVCYSALTPELKRCFAYCAIFKKGVTIYKDELVKLLMAQGLVPYSSYTPELEAIGDEYVSKLKRRSFFQVVKKKDGKTISFSMHHTIHEFAQYITNQEFAVQKIDDANDFMLLHHSLIRHLTLLYPDDGDNKFPPSVYKAQGLRTLRVQPIGWRSKLGKAPPADIFSRLARLRALDLSKSDIERFPGQVEQLIHLRYLNLSETNLKRLPEKVCNLYNLQTLGLNKCIKLVELPQGIRKMKNLRHLEISDTKELKLLPQGIGTLTSLRTLSKFIVGGGCKIGELKKLDSLRGCLEIRDIEKVANPDEAKEAEMHNKEHLHELKLNFTENGMTADKDLERLIEGLKPHPNLKKLEILNYPGTSFPNFWMTKEKLELEVLILGKFKKCKKLSLGGELKKLGEIEIHGMDELTKIDYADHHLKDLHELRLVNCPKLEGLLCQLHDHKKLKKLVINGCAHLDWTATASSSPSSSFQPPLKLPELEHLSLYGNSLSFTDIHLPKLEYLLISNCGSLPQSVGQFKELKQLVIEDCYNNIPSLPKELQHLHNLRELRLTSCPNLGSRCKKEDWGKEEDWGKKITIIIDGVIVNRASEKA